MKWSDLYNKIGKQPIRILRTGDVYVVDRNGNKRTLDVKYDAHNVPYFVFNELTEFKEN